ncbi:hypothetical protein [Chitinimonas sp.]|uniref:hypothetical protein n=1 Tax=Chitinimonas sp. TaxID=1934313 RepID=UPI0035AF9336
MPRHSSDHRAFAHTPKAGREPPQPFVYMLPLTDGRGFKLGRTENLLHRVTAFSIRYFEDFNLHDAPIARCQTKAQTVALEKMLKRLAAVRIEPPEWIVWSARCPTEWFTATAADSVRQCLANIETDPDFSGIGLDTAYDEIKRQLIANQEHMTAWAMATWGEIRDRAAARGGYHVSTLLGRQLQASLDAYCRFGMPLLDGWEPEEGFVACNRTH